MSNRAKTVSVCIPTYEMKGKGAEYLRHSFDILAEQTFKNFDVVISDHSQDDAIKNLCEGYRDKLTIHYYRNEEHRGSSSANINNAMRKATGDLIKILFQDDFLFHKNALKDIVEHFDMEKDHWLVTACEHSNDGVTFYRPFYPRWNKYVYIGMNTISSPSVLTIKREREVPEGAEQTPLLFNERLIWLMDCEYYQRLHTFYGPPKILNSINVVNRTHPNQVTNTLATEEVQEREHELMLKMYGYASRSQRIKEVMRKIRKKLRK